MPHIIVRCAVFAITSGAAILTFGQPKEDIRAVIPMLASYAGQVAWAVEMCGDLHPDQKAPNAVAFEKVRQVNIDLMSEAEKLDRYSATIASLKRRYDTVAKEGRETVCAELPREIERMSQMLKDLREEMR